MTNLLHPSKRCTSAIDQAIATALRDGLANHADGHCVASYDEAAELIHDAGLSTCLIPCKRSARSREWDVLMAVIDRGLADPWGGVRVFDGRVDELSVKLKTYALLPLRPMQEYVSDMMACNLSNPWYGVPLSPLARVLVPRPSTSSSAIGHGTAARENWQIFLSDFDALWSSGEHSVKPTIQLDIKRLRYPMTRVQPETKLLPRNLG